MIVNRNQSKLTGIPAGTIMDKAEFDKAFKSAPRKPLHTYDGSGRILRVLRHINIGCGVMLRKGESYHAVDNGMEWLICTDKSRMSRIGTIGSNKLARLVEDGIVEIDSNRRSSDSAYEAKTNRVVVKFMDGDPNDEAMLKHLREQSNVTAYLKTLIAADMN